MNQEQKVLNNVLLISLQKDLDTIGLKYIHYHLNNNVFSSHILYVPNFDTENISESGTSNIVKYIYDKSPLFIGISLMSTEYKFAVELTNIIKSNLPDIPIVWGGIHPTIAPETCLDFADYCCVGESERTLLELANSFKNNKDPRDVKNMVYRSNGKMIKNELYQALSNLDELSIIEHIPVNSSVYHNNIIEPINIASFRKFARYCGTVYSAITSRGCPFSCTYCCNNALSAIYDSKKVRFRSVENVIQELKKAVNDNPFIREINFQDDCFLARSQSELELFCELYKKEVKKQFVIRSIPTFVTEEKLALLKSAGMAWVSLGLQSGSDRVCTDIYRRKSLQKDFIKAANIIKKLDLAAFYDVIMDNPFETEDDYLATIETLMSIPKPFYTQYFSLSLYPGTELRKKALEEGLIKEDEYQSKDYLAYSDTSINKLTRLSSHIPLQWMNKIIEMYKFNPNSIELKIHISLAKLLALVLFEPIMNLKVIWLSQRRSYIGTLQAIPIYMGEGIWRILKQF